MRLTGLLRQNPVQRGLDLAVLASVCPQKHVDLQVYARFFESLASRSSIIMHHAVSWRRACNENADWHCLSRVRPCSECPDLPDQPCATGSGLQTLGTAVSGPRMQGAKRIDGACTASTPALMVDVSAACCLVAAKEPAERQCCKQPWGFLHLHTGPGRVMPSLPQAVCLLPYFRSASRI